MNGLSLTGMYVLAALLIAAGLGMGYFIVRSGPSRRPESGIEWSVLVLSLLAALTGAGFIALTLAGKVTSSPGPESRTVVGEPASPLRFRLVETNQEKRLSDYRGKVVVLNLWATWCPPCLEELPELNRLQERYGPDGLVVVTISDERRETLQRFERKKVSLQTVSGYLPPSQSWPAPYDKVRSSRPMSFIIDRDGRIQNLWRGSADFSQFERAVSPHL
ncbi:MAG TPA: TlpA disulfide reductase family protein [Salinibacter sp.]|nr:TlpA disulfide reductase family protein [Salinibacter sp.]